MLFMDRQNVRNAKCPVWAQFITITTCLTLRDGAIIFGHVTHIPDFMSVHDFHDIINHFQ